MFICVFSLFSPKKSALIPGVCVTVFTVFRKKVHCIFRFFSAVSGGVPLPERVLFRVLFPFRGGCKLPVVVVFRRSDRVISRRGCSSWVLVVSAGWLRASSDRDIIRWFHDVKKRPFGRSRWVSLSWLSEKIILSVCLSLGISSRAGCS